MFSKVESSPRSYCVLGVGELPAPRCAAEISPTGVGALAAEADRGKPIEVPQPE